MIKFHLDLIPLQGQIITRNTTGLFGFLRILPLIKVYVIMFNLNDVLFVF